LINFPIFSTKHWPVETYINCEKVCRVPKAKEAERDRKKERERERERGRPHRERVLLTPQESAKVLEISHQLSAD